MVNMWNNSDYKWISFWFLYADHLYDRTPWVLTSLTHAIGLPPSQSLHVLCLIKVYRTNYERFVLKCQLRKKYFSAYINELYMYIHMYQQTFRWTEIMRSYYLGKYWESLLFINLAQSAIYAIIGQTIWDTLYLSAMGSYLSLAAHKHKSCPHTGTCYVPSLFVSFVSILSIRVVHVCIYLYCKFI